MCKFIKIATAIMDTEYWMSNLPPKLKQLPLIHLAIPGSHDSMTSTITYHCPLAPDAENILQQLKFLGPVLRFIMARWSKTQSLNLLEQLKAGIRYFDFRVATKKGSIYPYFVHGLYATEAVPALKDLNRFLNSHPSEIVIMDFQHFYAFDKIDHENFMRFLLSKFRGKITPYCHNMQELSLSHLEKYGYQVFIIYRSGYGRYNQQFFWPDYTFPTPWPQTVCVTDLITKLNHGLRTRSSKYGYVSQFVLTPTIFFVSKHIFSTLKKQCAAPIQKAKIEWLQKQINGPNGVNIVICDFIELDHYTFSKEIININLKSILHENSLTPVDNDK